MTDGETVERSNGETVRWSMADLRDALKVEPVGACEGGGAVVIDSRAVKPGDIFVCIKGENTDGHLYIDKALAAGAKVIVALRDHAHENPASGVALFPVGDTTLALGELAAYHRGRLRGAVIGVTGSSGKTSAKEMLHALGRELVGDEFVTATRGNLNNHWGLPLSVLAARPEDRLVILEMGMNHAGEIAYLSRIARPHFSLITSVSEAHIEFFDSILGIAAAKLEILEGMEGGALAFPASATGLEKAREEAKRRDIALLEFDPGASTRTGAFGMEFRFGDDTIRNTHYFSSVMASNLLGALSILERAGFERKRLMSAASAVKPATGRRFQVFRRKAGAREQILVDDSYNANESSFREALRALRDLLPMGRLALAAGPMAELGERGGPAHGRMGELAAELGYETVALVESPDTEEFSRAYLSRINERITARTDEPAGRQSGDRSGENQNPPRNCELLTAPNADVILKNLQPRLTGDGFDGILVKGSRSARMDIVADGIKELGYV